MKKKTIRIVVIVFVFLFISNAVATKIIYDTVFKRYDPEPLSEYFNAEDYASFEKTAQGFIIPEGDEELKAYFYDKEDETGLIVIAPGMNAGARDFLPVIFSFSEAGYDVLIFDPLGCCDSTGKSMKGFSQEIYDLRTVLDYAQSEYPEEDIYLFGHSRGAFAAVANLEYKENIKAAVSVSGHNSAMDAIIAFSARYVGGIANLNYPALWCYQAMLFGADIVNLKAVDMVNSCDRPVMIVQGSEDKSAPAKKYSLYSHRDEIKEGNVTYYFSDEKDKSGHTDIMFENGGANSDLMEAVIDFYVNSALAE